jgi:hypothetical protein
VRNLLVASLAVTLAACGGPLLGGEVQEQKICVKKAATVVDGICKRSEFVPLATAAAALVQAGHQVAGVTDAANVCAMDVGALYAMLSNPLLSTFLPSGVQDAINNIRQADATGTFPLGDQIPALDKKGTTGSIKVQSLAVSGTSSALAMLDSLGAEFTKDSQPVLTLEYVKDGTSYACDSGTPKTCTMTVGVKAGTDDDIFKHLNGGNIDYHITVKGTPGPEALSSMWNDWNASVETCMSASLTVDALELIKNN